MIVAVTDGPTLASPEHQACFTADGAAELEQRTIISITGRWKIANVFRLFERPLVRFPDLHLNIEGVSHKLITRHLREREIDGLVLRTDYDEVPPRVTYRLTPRGLALRPILTAMRDFATVGVRHLSAGDVEETGRPKV